MNQLDAKSVVVGINGSQAAVNAAKWAIDEALSRQMPLRLVYVIPRQEAQIGSAPISDQPITGCRSGLRGHRSAGMGV
jgi:nucleotide-binding universal stress UspA family protein